MCSSFSNVISRVTIMGKKYLIEYDKVPKPSLTDVPFTNVQLAY